MKRSLVRMNFNTTQTKSQPNSHHSHNHPQRTEYNHEEASDSTDDAPVTNRNGLLMNVGYMAQEVKVSQRAVSFLNDP
jgi:hypothetical protein